MRANQIEFPCEIRHNEKFTPNSLPTRINICWVDNEDHNFKEKGLNYSFKHGWCTFENQPDELFNFRRSGNIYSKFHHQDSFIWRSNVMRNVQLNEWIQQQQYNNIKTLSCTWTVRCVPTLRLLYNFARVMKWTQFLLSNNKFQLNRLSINNISIFYI